MVIGVCIVVIACIFLYNPRTSLRARVDGLIQSIVFKPARGRPRRRRVVSLATDGRRGKENLKNQQSVPFLFKVMTVYTYVFQQKEGRPPYFHGSRFVKRGNLSELSSRVFERE